jgi:hypothetical protein
MLHAERFVNDMDRIFRLCSFGGNKGAFVVLEIRYLCVNAIGKIDHKNPDSDSNLDQTVSNCNDSTPRST